VKSWTASGVLVVQEPTGGCGCGAFDMEMMSGHSSLVDPVTGVATRVTADDSCPLSGVGPGGVSACFHSGGSGADARAVRRALRWSPSTRRRVRSVPSSPAVS
jgi:hypothetical protein